MIFVGMSRSRLNNLADQDFNFPPFTSTFDAFVAILEEILKVLSELLVNGTGLRMGKLLGKPGKGVFVKLVHVGLEITELSEDFAAISRWVAMRASTAIENALVSFSPCTRV